MLTLKGVAKRKTDKVCMFETFVKPYQKFVSGVVSVCFFLSMVAVPPPALGQSLVENISQNISVSSPLVPLNIPRELASIEEVFLPNSDSVGVNPLIHIQSVHAHPETQRKIYGLLKFLEEKYGIESIFVEGAGEELNPGFFRFFNENDLNVRVAEKLVERGELTGAELFLIESERNIPAYGLEEPSLYRENLTSFQAVMAQRALTSRFTESARGHINRLETLLLQPQARKLLRSNEAFDAGRLELISYLFELTRKTEDLLGLDLRHFENQIEWPQTIRLLRLQEIESDLEPERIQSDRERMISFLKQIPVDSELIESFQNLSFSPYQSGMVYDPGFRKNDLPRYLAERLVIATLEKGFSFEQYPYFTRFLEAAVLQSELEAERLFDEIERLFERLVNAVSSGEEDLKLVGLTREEKLLERLFDLELTPKDYSKIHAFNKTDRALVRFLLNIESLNQKAGVGAEGIVPENIGAVESIYSEAIRFYQFAKEREEVMVGKILNSSGPLPRKNNGVTILITGGFHTDGLSRSFRKKQIPYTLLTPRITERVSVEAYVSSLLGEKKTAFDVQHLESDLDSQSLGTLYEGMWPVNRRDALHRAEVRTVLNAFLEVTNEDKKPAGESALRWNRSLYARDRGSELHFDAERRVLLPFVKRKPLVNAAGLEFGIPTTPVVTQTEFDVAIPAASLFDRRAEVRSKESARWPRHITERRIFDFNGHNNVMNQIKNRIVQKDLQKVYVFGEEIDIEDKTEGYALDVVQRIQEKIFAKKSERREEKPNYVRIWSSDYSTLELTEPKIANPYVDFGTEVLRLPPSFIERLDKGGVALLDDLVSKSGEELTAMGFEPEEVEQIQQALGRFQLKLRSDRETTRQVGVQRAEVRAGAEPTPEEALGEILKEFNALQSYVSMPVSDLSGSLLVSEKGSIAAEKALGAEKKDEALRLLQNAATNLKNLKAEAERVQGAGEIVKLGLKPDTSPKVFLKALESQIERIEALSKTLSDFPENHKPRSEVRGRGPLLTSPEELKRIVASAPHATIQMGPLEVTSGKIQPPSPAVGLAGEFIPPLPAPVLARLGLVVAGRPYYDFYSPRLAPEVVIRGIVETAQQIHRLKAKGGLEKANPLFGPSDVDVLSILIEMAKQPVAAQAAEEKLVQGISRLLPILAKGHDLPGDGVAILESVPNELELRGLVLPLSQNKKARLKILVAPEAIRNAGDASELGKRMAEVRKLFPEGRVGLAHPANWEEMYDAIGKAAREAYGERYPTGLKFETFLERHFVVSLPEALSGRLKGVEEKLGKAARTVTYGIPRSKIRAAYVLVVSGVVTKLSQDVLSRLQKLELFDIRGSRYQMRTEAFQTVEAIWKAFENYERMLAAA